MNPREYFETQWPVIMGAVPLIDASNVEIDTDDLPSPWVGMLVQSEQLRHMTMGTQPFTEETGTIVLGVFTKAGDGVAQSDVLARDINQKFMGWRSADTKFEVRQITGPYDLEPESDGNWHRLALELSYGLWGRKP